MTDKTENVVSESSSGMIESERLAQILDDMIIQAATKKEEDILVIPENREPEKKRSSHIDGIIVIPQNAPAEVKITPSQEPVEEEEPFEEFPKEPSEEFPKEPSEEFPKEPPEEVVEEPEIEVEAEEAPEAEVVEEQEVEAAEEVAQDPVEIFVKAETPEENCIKTPAVSTKVASAVAELLNNIDENLSRIIVAAPSEKEDSSRVALLIAMGLSSSKKVLFVNCNPSDTLNVCPTDMENLFFMSAGEDVSFDSEGFDTVVYAMSGEVNTEALTDDCGVLLIVKPKVTPYGAYRKALKSLHKSQAKILGAVIV